MKRKSIGGLFDGWEKRGAYGLHTSRQKGAYDANSEGWGWGA